MVPVAVPEAGYTLLQALIAGSCACYLLASLHVDKTITSDIFLVAFLIIVRVCSVRVVRT